MRKSKLRYVLFAVAVCAMAIALHGVARADRWALACPSATFARCNAVCPGVSDPHTDKHWIGSSSVTCAVNSLPTCIADAWATADKNWSVHGGGSCDGTDGDYLIATVDSLYADGTRLSDSLFRVTGVAARSPLATHERSVLRYRLDIDELDTLSCNGAMGLVDLGVIAAEDILLLVADDSIPSSFSFDVNVAGLNDSSITIMQYGHGVSSGDPIPTLPEWGLIVLSMLLLITAVWWMRKRRESATPA